MEPETATNTGATHPHPEIQFQPLRTRYVYRHDTETWINVSTAEIYPKEFVPPPEPEDGAAFSDISAINYPHQGGPSQDQAQVPNQAQINAELFAVLQAMRNDIANLRNSPPRGSQGPDAAPVHPQPNPPSGTRPPPVDEQHAVDRQIIVGKLQPRKPDDFKGDATLVKQFLRQIQTYVDYDITLTPRQQVRFALQHCVGPRVGPWADRQTSLIQRGDEDALVTMDQFGEALENTFGDPDRKRKAQRKLHTLKLSQTQTVSQARVIFEELAEEAEYDEEAQIHAWLSMMDDDLIQRLYLTDPLPTTISEWKRRAVRMDELRRAVQTEGTDRRFFGNRAGYWNPANRRPNQTPPTPGNRNERRPPPTNAPSNRFMGQSTPSAPARPPYTPPVTQNSVPMDIDRAKGRGNMGMRRRNIQCFRCGQMGHIARDCTAKVDIRATTTEAGETQENDEKEGVEGFREAEED